MNTRTLLRSASMVSLLALGACTVPTSAIDEEAQDSPELSSSESALTSPHYTIRLHAIVTADDDGTKANMTTRAQVKAWVDKANSIFTAADAGISLSFDDSASSLDFETRNDTKLNHLSSARPGEWAYANEIAARYPGKLVVYFRRDDGAGNGGNGFSFPPSEGSAADTGFIAMPAFNNTSVTGDSGDGVERSLQNIWQLAHDIGHHLGLGHTFPGWSDGGTDTDEEVINLLTTKGDNALDGDGIADTPAEAGTAYFDKKGWSRCKGHDNYALEGVVDGVGKLWQFQPARNNVMSYFACETMRFTPGQVAKMRATLQHPKRNHLITRPCHADFYGVAASKFQTCFNYWIHRGLWPVSVAAYDVSGTTFMAGSFQKGTNRPVYVLMTEDDFKSKITTFKAQGFRPSQIQVLSTSNGPRYSVVWQPIDGTFETATNLTTAQLGTKIGFMRTWGFDVVDLASFAEAGDIHHAVTFVYRGSMKASVLSEVNGASVYQARFEEQAAAGFRPARFSAVPLATATKYSALFVPNDKAFYQYAEMTPSFYDTKYAELSKLGFRLEHVSAKSGSTPRFSAIWVK